jgi:hypothetical protein
VVLFFLPGAGQTLFALDKRCDNVHTLLALHTEAMPSGAVRNESAGFSEGKKKRQRKQRIKVEKKWLGINL